MNYDVFHSLYQNSEVIKNIVKNYNEDGIEFDQGGELPATKQSGDTVSKMAKRATDLTDLN